MYVYFTKEYITNVCHSYECAGQSSVVLDKQATQ